MHYHLASSYYSFFFLYIYISRVPNLHENQQNAHVSSVMNFPKKKRNVRSYVYTCVYAYVCTYTRVQQHEENVLGIHISSLSRVLNFLNFSLYSSPSSSFFFSLFVCYFIVASFFFYFPRCVIIISLNAQLTSYSELQLFTNLVK